MCLEGNLWGFKLALTRQEVPIHAQIKNGWTLLHMACLSGSLELCSLLIELGVDASQEDDIGRKALHIFSNWSDKPGIHVEDMVRLMILDQEHVEEEDITQFLEYYIGPPEGIECILSPDVCPTEIDWTHLPTRYLVKVVRFFALGATEWTKVVQRIVRQAEDLHCPHVEDQSPDAKPLTLLDELLGMTRDPIEGVEASEAWLTILAAEGVDVRAYLEVEIGVHTDYHTPPYPI